MSSIAQDASRSAPVTPRDLLSRHAYALSIVRAVVGGVTAALTLLVLDVLAGHQ